MSSSIIATGTGKKSYRSLLLSQVSRAKPEAMALAVAYVSVAGFLLVRSIFNAHGVKRVRLVVDTKDGVTHPSALQKALDEGWEVRTVGTLPGTFHPKLYVGAADFDDSDGLKGLSLVMVSSANISHKAFFKNVECTYSCVTPGARKSAAVAWLECWSVGAELDQKSLDQYASYFAKINRKRAPRDLTEFEVDDGVATIATESGNLLANKRKAIPETAASVAWAGLQTFTGEYRLQVEFPREAGLVLRRIFTNLSAEGNIEILCADGEVRTFRFRFYEDNGMFRLNVPNDVPLVDWVRDHKEGICYVEHREDDQIYFEIVRPGERMTDVMQRSFALGTWGRTPTRFYGWY